MIRNASIAGIVTALTAGFSGVMIHQGSPHPQVEDMGASAVGALMEEGEGEIEEDVDLAETSRFSSKKQASSALGGNGELTALSGTGNVDQGTNTTIEAGSYVTVGGGKSNSVKIGDNGAPDYSVIGGGLSNSVSEFYGTISGGYRNNAAGIQATIGGGHENQAYGSAATVAGGFNNEARNTDATVSGGSYNIADGAAAVSGGTNNYAAALSAVAGGELNEASGSHAFVGAGFSNTAAGETSFAAGSHAKANHNGAFVWADATGTDFASTVTNQFAIRAGGGVFLNAPYLQLGTGATAGHVLTADNNGKGTWKAPASGIQGVTAGTGLSGGGTSGTPMLAISPTYTLPQTCAGGQLASWSGALWQCASDKDSGGDLQGIIAGNGLTGGGASGTPTLSVAPLYLPVSCAAGQVSTWSSTSGWTCVNGGSGTLTAVSGSNGIQAYTTSGVVALALDPKYALPQSTSACVDGSIPKRTSAGTWACSELAISSTGQFVAQANAGVIFYTKADKTSGVSVAPGSGMWRSLSDRNSKRNVVEVETTAVLEGVMNLPISTWEYVSQDGGVAHMGPMAQDFYELFGLGEDDEHIGTADIDGVTLAAVQALARQMKAQETLLALQEKRIAGLVEKMETLTAANCEMPLTPASSPARDGLSLVAAGAGVATVLRRLMGG